jgi:hypothetical protein
MPRKTHTLTDEECANRIRKTTKEIGTSNNPGDFERPFGKVVTSKHLKPAKDKISKGKTIESESLIGFLYKNHFIANGIVPLRLRNQANDDCRHRKDQ